MKEVTLLILCVLLCNFALSAEIVLNVETVYANNGSEGVIVPVNVNFPSDSLYSSADISFAGYFGEMTFVEVNTDGTLIGNAGWALQYNETGEFLITALAGAEDISGSGVLFNLVFDIPADAVNGFIPITIESAVFNTGTDSVTANDGGVNVIIVSTPEDEAVQGTKLIGNYPNPFSNSTTILFSLAATLHENARIEIFNIKGQKVEGYSIFNSQSSIIWDSSEYPNGIYFYKLETDNKSFIKKMILMR